MAIKSIGRLTLLLAAVVFMAAVAGTAQTKPAPKATKTLENLQAAYNGEGNAHAKYRAFAKKADEEGYRGVASLFRAAARAEQIHLTNHAAVIRQMGFEPLATIETPVVKSTGENLLASANKGEAYERDTMYAEFIRQARLEVNFAAVRTFEYARTNLQNMKEATTYYVCTMCGYTTHNPHAKCPSCGMVKERYERSAEQRVNRDPQRRLWPHRLRSD
jgi:rubrerythrin